MCHRVLGTFLFCFSLVMSPGCGSSGPELHPVTGIISYLGQPLAGATVTFIPEGGGIGTGITDDAGKYEIRTGGQPGVVAGPSAVTVVKKSSGGLSSTADMSPEKMQEMAMSGQLQQQLEEGNKSEIPERYAIAKDSGLRFEVKSGEENVFNIDLN